MECSPDARLGHGCSTRRAVLSAAAGVGSLLGIGACSTNDPSDAARSGGAASVAPLAAPPSDAPAGDPASRRRLIEAASVPIGGGVVEAGVLIVQPLAGRFRAYEAICPHQGIRLGPPRQGVIICTAHSSQFRDRDGALLRGPATQGLTKVPVVVDGGVIYRV